MSKHTPGPWKIGELQDIDVVIESENGLEVCTVWSDSKYMGDSRLIATAPDLLDALKTMVRAFHTYAPKTEGAEYNCVIDARAAIAKAEGEA